MSQPEQVTQVAVRTARARRGRCFVDHHT
jgi:hypothetical protein